MSTFTNPSHRNKQRFTIILNSAWLDYDYVIMRGVFFLNPLIPLVEPSR